MIVGKAYQFEYKIIVEDVISSPPDKELIENTRMIIDYKW